MQRISRMRPPYASRDVCQKSAPTVASRSHTPTDIDALADFSMILKSAVKHG